jgi:aminotransferase
LREYTGRRELLIKGLDDLGIQHTSPEGAYYVMLDISEYAYESDLDFCEKLAERVGVGAVPGSSFFREGVNSLIRLHFAKKKDTLYEALNRLENMKEKMPKR